MNALNSLYGNSNYGSSNFGSGKDLIPYSGRQLAEIAI